MFYVISPPSRTDWSFKRDDLIRLLSRDWPQLEITGPEDGMPPVRDVVWEYNRSDSYIEGSQDRAGQTQYLDGTPDMLAKYAVWWRRQVDPKQDLIFYNDGYTVVVPLTNDTTEETILKALHDS